MPDLSAEPLVELISRDRAGAALGCPDEGLRLGYDQLADAAAGLASRLASAGVGRGGRVAVVLPNGPEIIELLVAFAVLGATMAPLNPAYTEAEYRFYLEDLAPQPAGGSGAAPTARAAADGLAIVELHADETGGQPRLEMDGRPLRAAGFEPGRPDDPVLLLHTSGTTSRPKQVPLLQGNLTARPVATHYASRGPTCPSARCRFSTSMAWSPRHLRSWRPAGRWWCRAGSAPGVSTRRPRPRR